MNIEEEKEVKITDTLYKLCFSCSTQTVVVKLIFQLIIKVVYFNMVWYSCEKQNNKEII